MGTSSKRRSLQWFPKFIEVAQKLWPKKTAQNLAAKTDVSERAAAFWLAGTYDMSLDAARNLLRSEDGYAFLEALMGDCDARWWQRIKLTASAAVTRRALAEQAKRLQALQELRRQIDLDIE